MSVKTLMEYWVDQNNITYRQLLSIVAYFNAVCINDGIQGLALSVFFDSSYLPTEMEGNKRVKV